MSSSTATSDQPPPQQPQSTGPLHPPKSKSQPYYTISPIWTDITPIPQLDLDSPSTSIPGVSPTTGPALATIMYTPRYTEAMSYLRAVMAVNEFSQRVLALTEDVIGMNAAHYTVWLYRFRTLRQLWGIRDRNGGEAQGNGSKRREEEEQEGVKRVETHVDEKVVKGVEEELAWLEGVSEKHLKNYQIWHHRHSLIDLLPSLPTTELSFLNTILSYDTKNYHVWSYRQWLCTRFPTPLLTTPVELTATSTLLDSDVRNNSAWNHRYFISFGHKELSQLSGQPLKVRGKDFSMAIVDLEVVERELAFVKDRIRLAPQNGSAWNYLRGILKHAGINVTEIKEFAGEFVGADFNFRTEADEASGVRGVRSSHAVEVLIEVFEAEGTADAKRKVREGFEMLSEKWDPIRRRYWEYRLRGLEERWKREGEGEES